MSVVSYDPFLRGLALIATGEELPDLDETQMRLLADSYDSCAERLEQVAPIIGRMVTSARTNFQGQAADAFVEVMAPYVEGTNNYINASAEHFRDMAEVLRDLALDVEYMKLVILNELILLAAEFAIAAALEYFVPEIWAWFEMQAATRGTLINIAIRTVKARFPLLSKVAWNGRYVLSALAANYGNQIGVVVLAQGTQMAMGTRDEGDWNEKYISDAAVVATVGLFLAPIAHGMGSQLGKVLTKMLARYDTAGRWHKNFAKNVSEVLAEGAHEFGTETVAIAILTGQFVANVFALTAGMTSGAMHVAGKALGGLIRLLEQAGVQPVISEHHPETSPASANANNNGDGSDTPGSPDSPGSTAPAHSSTTNNTSPDSGLEVRPDGSEVRPDGSEVRPDGSEVRPDGSEVRPDGSEVRSDGSQVNPGGPQVRPDGSQVNPGGPEVRPDGSEVRSDGSQVNPGGPQVRPDGSQVNAGGPDVRSDGPEVRPDGSEVRSDGSQVNPGGSQVNADGSQVRPDGLQVRPDGSEVRPGGSQVNAGGPDVRSDDSEVRPDGSEVRTDGSQVNAGGPEVRSGGLAGLAGPLGGLAGSGRPGGWSDGVRRAVRRLQRVVRIRPEIAEGDPGKQITHPETAPALPMNPLTAATPTPEMTQTGHSAQEKTAPAQVAVPGSASTQVPDSAPPSDRRVDDQVAAAENRIRRLAARLDKVEGRPDSKSHELAKTYVAQIHDVNALSARGMYDPVVRVAAAHVSKKEFAKKRIAEDTNGLGTENQEWSKRNNLQGGAPDPIRADADPEPSTMDDSGAYAGTLRNLAARLGPITDEQRQQVSELVGEVFDTAKLRELNVYDEVVVILAHEQANHPDRALDRAVDMARRLDAENMTFTSHRGELEAVGQKAKKFLRQKGLHRDDDLADARTIVGAVFDPLRLDELDVTDLLVWVVAEALVQKRSLAEAISTARKWADKLRSVFTVDSVDVLLEDLQQDPPPADLVAQARSAMGGLSARSLAGTGYTANDLAKVAAYLSRDMRNLTVEDISRTILDLLDVRDSSSETSFDGLREILQSVATDYVNELLPDLPQAGRARYVVPATVALVPLNVLDEMSTEFDQALLRVPEKKVGELRAELARDARDQMPAVLQQQVAEHTGTAHDASVGEFAAVIKRHVREVLVDRAWRYGPDQNEAHWKGGDKASQQTHKELQELQKQAGREVANYVSREGLAELGFSRGDMVRTVAHQVHTSPEPITVQEATKTLAETFGVARTEPPRTKQPAVTTDWGERAAKVVVELQDGGRVVDRGASAYQAWFREWKGRTLPGVNVQAALSMKDKFAPDAARVDGIDDVIGVLEKSGGPVATAMVFEERQDGRGLVLNVIPDSSGNFTVTGPQGGPLSKEQDERLSSGRLGTLYALGFATDGQVILGNFQMEPSAPGRPGTPGKRGAKEVGGSAGQPKAAGVWQRLGLDRTKEIADTRLKRIKRNNPEYYATLESAGDAIVSLTHDRRMLTDEQASSLERIMMFRLASNFDIAYVYDTSRDLAENLGTTPARLPNPADRDLPSLTVAMVNASDGLAMLTEQHRNTLAAMVERQLANAPVDPTAVYQLVQSTLQSWGIQPAELWTPPHLTDDSIDALMNTSWTRARTEVASAFARAALHRFLPSLDQLDEARTTALDEVLTLVHPVRLDEAEMEDWIVEVVAYVLVLGGADKNAAVRRILTGMVDGLDLGWTPARFQDSLQVAPELVDIDEDLRTEVREKIDSLGLTDRIGYDHDDVVRVVAQLSPHFEGDVPIAGMLTGIANGRMRTEEAALGPAEAPSRSAAPSSPDAVPQDDVDLDSSVPNRPARSDDHGMPPVPSSAAHDDADLIVEQNFAVELLRNRHLYQRVTGLLRDKLTLADWSRADVTALAQRMAAGLDLLIGEGSTRIGEFRRAWSTELGKDLTTPADLIEARQTLRSTERPLNAEELREAKEIVAKTILVDDLGHENRYDTAVELVGYERGMNRLEKIHYAQSIGFVLGSANPVLIANPGAIDAGEVFAEFVGDPAGGLVAKHGVEFVGVGRVGVVLGEVDGPGNDGVAAVVSVVADWRSSGQVWLVRNRGGVLEVEGGSSSVLSSLRGVDGVVEAVVVDANGERRRWSWSGDRVLDMAKSVARGVGEGQWRVGAALVAAAVEEHDRRVRGSEVGSWEYFEGLGGYEAVVTVVASGVPRGVDDTVAYGLDDVPGAGGMARRIVRDLAQPPRPTKIHGGGRIPESSWKRIDAMKAAGLKPGQIRKDLLDDPNVPDKDVPTENAMHRRWSATRARFKAGVSEGLLPAAAKGVKIKYSPEMWKQVVELHKKGFSEELILDQLNKEKKFSKLPSTAQQVRNYLILHGYLGWELRGKYSDEVWNRVEQLYRSGMKEKAIHEKLLTELPKKDVPAVKLITSHLNFKELKVEYQAASSRFPDTTWEEVDQLSAAGNGARKIHRLLTADPKPAVPTIDRYLLRKRLGRLDGRLDGFLSEFSENVKNLVWRLMAELPPDESHPATWVFNELSKEVPDEDKPSAEQVREAVSMVYEIEAPLAAAELAEMDSAELAEFVGAMEVSVGEGKFDPHDALISVRDLVGGGLQHGHVGSGVVGRLFRLFPGVVVRRELSEFFRVPFGGRGGTAWTVRKVVEALDEWFGPVGDIAEGDPRRGWAELIVRGEADRSALHHFGLYEATVAAVASALDVSAPAATEAAVYRVREIAALVRARVANDGRPLWKGGQRRARGAMWTKLMSVALSPRAWQVPPQDLATAERLLRVAEFALWMTGQDRLTDFWDNEELKHAAEVYLATASHAETDRDQGALHIVSELLREQEPAERLLGGADPTQNTTTTADRKEPNLVRPAVDVSVPELDQDAIDLARRALMERAEVKDPDGTALRNLIVEMVGGQWKGKVDEDFADENLADLTSALEGIDKNFGGVQVKVQAVGIGPATDETEGTPGRKSMHESRPSTAVASENRERTPLNPTSLLSVPTPVGTFAAQVKGIGTKSTSSSSAKEERTHSVSTTEDVDTTDSRHDVRYEVTVQPGRSHLPRRHRPAAGRRAVDVPMTLTWPKHDQGPAGRPKSVSLSYPQVPNNASPETRAKIYEASANVRKLIQHVQFAGLTDIHDVVVEKYGLDPADPEVGAFRGWLDGLAPSHGADLATGGHEQKMFMFRHRGPTIIRVMRALRENRTDPLSTQPVDSGHKSIEHKRRVSASHGTKHGVTSEWGGSFSYSVGQEISDALGATLGGSVSYDRSAENTRERVEQLRSEFTSTVKGNFDQHDDVEFDFLVSVVDARKSTPADPDRRHRISFHHRDKSVPQILVKGAARLWLSRPGETESAGDSGTESETSPGVSRPKSGMSKTEVPQQARALWQLPEKTLQQLTSGLLGPVLHRMQASGEIDPTQLGGIQSDFKKFLNGNVRSLFDGGDWVRFPLPGADKDLFLNGDLLANLGRYKGEVAWQEIAGKLTAGDTTQLGNTRIRNASAHLNSGGEVAPATITGDLGVSRESSRGGGASQTVEIERSWTSDSHVHKYDYPAYIHARLGADVNDLDAPGQQFDVPGDVQVLVPKRPGTGVVIEPKPAQPKPAQPKPALPKPALPETDWADSDTAVLPVMRPATLPTVYDLESVAPVRGLASTTKEMLAPPSAEGYRAKAGEAVKRLALGDKPTPLGAHHEGEDERDSSRDAVERWARWDARQGRLGLAAGPSDELRLEGYNDANMFGLGSRDVIGTAKLTTKYGNARIVDRDDEHEFSETHNTRTELPTKQSTLNGAAATLTTSFDIEGAVSMGPEASLGYRRGPERSAVDTTETANTHSWVERGYLVEFDGQHRLDTSVHESLTGPLGDQHPRTSTEHSKSKFAPRAVKVWVPASHLPTIGTLTDHDVNTNLHTDDRTAYQNTHSPTTTQQTQTRNQSQTSTQSQTQPQSNTQAQAQTQTQSQTSTQGNPQTPAPAQNQPAQNQPAQNQPAQTSTTSPSPTGDLPAAGHGVGSIEPGRAELVREFMTGLREKLRVWESTIEDPDLAAKFAKLHDGLVQNLGARMVLGGFDSMMNDMLNGGLPLLGERIGDSGKLEQLGVVKARLVDGRRIGTDPKHTHTLTASTESKTKVGKKSIWRAAFSALGTPTLPAFPGSFLIEGLFAPKAGVSREWTRGPEQVSEKKHTTTYSRTGAADRYQAALEIDFELRPWARSGIYRRRIPLLRKAHIRGQHVTDTFTLADGAVRVTLPADLPIGNTPLDTADGSLRASWARPNNPGGTGFPDDAAIMAWTAPAPKLHQKIHELANGLNSRRADGLLVGTGAGQFSEHFRDTLSPGGYTVDVGSRTISTVTVKSDLGKRELMGEIPDASLEHEMTESDQTVRPSKQDTTFAAGLLGGALADVAGNIEQGFSRESEGAPGPKTSKTTTSSGKAYLVRAELDTTVIVGNRNGSETVHHIGPDGEIWLRVDEAGLKALGLKVPGNAPANTPQSSSKSATTNTRSTADPNTATQSRQTPRTATDGTPATNGTPDRTDDVQPGLARSGRPASAAVEVGGVGRGRPSRQRWTDDGVHRAARAVDPSSDQVRKASELLETARNKAFTKLRGEGMRVDKVDLFQNEDHAREAARVVGSVVDAAEAAALAEDIVADLYAQRLQNIPHGGAPTDAGDPHTNPEAEPGSDEASEGADTRPASLALRPTRPANPSSDSPASGVPSKRRRPQVYGEVWVGRVQAAREAAPDRQKGDAALKKALDKIYPDAPSTRTIGEILAFLVEIDATSAAWNGTRYIGDVWVDRVQAAREAAPDRQKGEVALKEALDKIYPDAPSAKTIGKIVAYLVETGAVSAAGSGGGPRVGDVWKDRVLEERRAAPKGRKGPPLIQKTLKAKYGDAPSTGTIGNIVAELKKEGLLAGSGGGPPVGGPVETDASLAVGNRRRPRVYGDVWVDRVLEAWRAAPKRGKGEKALKGALDEIYPDAPSAGTIGKILASLVETGAVPAAGSGGGASVGGPVETDARPVGSRGRLVYGDVWKDRVLEERRAAPKGRKGPPLIQKTLKAKYGDAPSTGTISKILAEAEATPRRGKRRRVEPVGVGVQRDGRDGRELGDGGEWAGDYDEVVERARARVDEGLAAIVRAFDSYNGIGRADALMGRLRELADTGSIGVIGALRRSPVGERVRELLDGHDDKLYELNRLFPSDEGVGQFDEAVLIRPVGSELWSEFVQRRLREVGPQGDGQLADAAGLLAGALNKYVLLALADSDLRLPENVGIFRDEDERQDARVVLADVLARHPKWAAVAAWDMVAGLAAERWEGVEGGTPDEAGEGSAEQGDTRGAHQGIRPTFDQLIPLFDGASLVRAFHLAHHGYTEPAASSLWSESSEIGEVDLAEVVDRVGRAPGSDAVLFASLPDGQRGRALHVANRDGGTFLSYAYDRSHRARYPVTVDDGRVMVVRLGRQLPLNLPQPTTVWELRAAVGGNGGDRQDAESTVGSTDPELRQPVADDAGADAERAQRSTGDDEERSGESDTGPEWSLGRIVDEDAQAGNVSDERLDDAGKVVAFHHDVRALDNAGFRLGMPNLRTMVLRVIANAVANEGREKAHEHAGAIARLLNTARPSRVTRSLDRSSAGGAANASAAREDQQEQANQQEQGIRLLRRRGAAQGSRVDISARERVVERIRRTSGSPVPLDRHPQQRRIMAVLRDMVVTAHDLESLGHEGLAMDDIAREASLEMSANPSPGTVYAVIQKLAQDLGTQRESVPDQKRIPLRRDRATLDQEGRGQASDLGRALFYGMLANPPHTSDSEHPAQPIRRQVTVSSTGQNELARVARAAAVGRQVRSAFDARRSELIALGLPPNELPVLELEFVPDYQNPSSSSGLQDPRHDHVVVEVREREPRQSAGDVQRWLDSLPAEMDGHREFPLEPDARSQDRPPSFPEPVFSRNSLSLNAAAAFQATVLNLPPETVRRSDWQQLPGGGVGSLVRVVDLVRNLGQGAVAIIQGSAPSVDSNRSWNVINAGTEGLYLVDPERENRLRVLSTDGGSLWVSRPDVGAVQVFYDDGLMAFRNDSGVLRTMGSWSGLEAVFVAVRDPQGRARVVDEDEVEGPDYTAGTGPMLLSTEEHPEFRLHLNRADNGSELIRFADVWLAGGSNRWVDKVVSHEPEFFGSGMAGVGALRGRLAGAENHGASAIVWIYPKNAGPTDRAHVWFPFNRHGELRMLAAESAEPLDGGTYGFLLDIAGGPGDASIDVYIYPPSGGPAQHWKMVNRGLKLRVVQDDNGVDVPDGLNALAGRIDGTAEARNRAAKAMAELRRLLELMRAGADPASLTNAIDAAQTELETARAEQARVPDSDGVMAIVRVNRPRKPMRRWVLRNDSGLVTKALVSAETEMPVSITDLGDVYATPLDADGEYLSWFTALLSEPAATNSSWFSGFPTLVGSSESVEPSPSSWFLQTVSKLSFHEETALIAAGKRIANGDPRLKPARRIVRSTHNLATITHFGLLAMLTRTVASVLPPADPANPEANLEADPEQIAVAVRTSLSFAVTLRTRVTDVWPNTTITSRAPSELRSRIQDMAQRAGDFTDQERGAARRYLRALEFELWRAGWDGLVADTSLDADLFAIMAGVLRDGTDYRGSVVLDLVTGLIDEQAQQPPGAPRPADAAVPPGRGPSGMDDLLVVWSQERLREGSDAVAADDPRVRRAEQIVRSVHNVRTLTHFGLLGQAVRAIANLLPRADSDSPRRELRVAAAVRAAVDLATFLRTAPEDELPPVAAANRPSSGVRSEIQETARQITRHLTEAQLRQARETVASIEYQWWRNAGDGLVNFWGTPLEDDLLRVMAFQNAVGDNTGRAGAMVTELLNEVAEQTNDEGPAGADFSGFSDPEETLSPEEESALVAAGRELAGDDPRLMQAERIVRSTHNNGATLTRFEFLRPQFVRAVASVLPPADPANPEANLEADPEQIAVAVQTSLTLAVTLRTRVTDVWPNTTVTSRAETELRSEIRNAAQSARDEARRADADFTDEELAGARAQLIRAEHSLWRAGWDGLVADTSLEDDLVAMVAANLRQARDPAAADHVFDATGVLTQLIEEQAQQPPGAPRPADAAVPPGRGPSGMDDLLVVWSQERLREGSDAVAADDPRVRRAEQIVRSVHNVRTLTHFGLLGQAVRAIANLLPRADSDSPRRELRVAAAVRAAVDLATFLRTAPEDELPPVAAANRPSSGVRSEIQETARQITHHLTEAQLHRARELLLSTEQQLWRRGHNGLVNFWGTPLEEDLLRVLAFGPEVEGWTERAQAMVTALLTEVVEPSSGDAAQSADQSGESPPEQTGDAGRSPSESSDSSEDLRFGEVRDRSGAGQAVAAHAEFHGIAVAEAEADLSNVVLQPFDSVAAVLAKVAEQAQGVTRRDAVVFRMSGPTLRVVNDHGALWLHWYGDNSGSHRVATFAGLAFAMVDGEYRPLDSVLPDAGEVRAVLTDGDTRAPVSVPTEQSGDTLIGPVSVTAGQLRLDGMDRALVDFARFHHMSLYDAWARLHGRALTWFGSGELGLANVVRQVLDGGSGTQALVSADAQDPIYRVFNDSGMVRLHWYGTDPATTTPLSLEGGSLWAMFDVGDWIPDLFRRNNMLSVLDGVVAVVLSPPAVEVAAEQVHREDQDRTPAPGRADDPSASGPRSPERAVPDTSAESGEDGAVGDTAESGEDPAIRDATAELVAVVPPGTSFVDPASFVEQLGDPLESGITWMGWTVPGLGAALAFESTWRGVPRVAASITAADSGLVEQAPQFVDGGAAGVRRVTGVLAGQAVGASAMLRVHAPNGSVRVFNMVRFGDDVLAVDLVAGTVDAVTDEVASDLVDAEELVYAHVFTPDGTYISMAPGWSPASPGPDADDDESSESGSDADAYELAELERARTVAELVETASLGGDVPVPGTGGRLVQWWGGLVLTGGWFTPEMVADLATTMWRDVIWYFVGPEGEEPRWVVFRPVGRPLPVKVSDLPPAAQAAINGDAAPADDGPRGRG